MVPPGLAVWKYDFSLNFLIEIQTEIDMLLISVRNNAKCVLSLVQETNSSIFKIENSL